MGSKCVMSKTRIADTLRLAIYEAYQGRCFYTGEPVAYIDFEVDHIIPESLASEIMRLWHHVKSPLLPTMYSPSSLAVANSSRA